ncbi:hypothetical protein [Nocardioides zeae]|uniref:hypothetical protein n=1 Tax=Nocardioides zeae TaxID=1457234 RepID=UPI00286A1034|nr:hypothetical protein [Nocardioides zeae]
MTERTFMGPALLSGSCYIVVQATAGALDLTPWTMLAVGAPVLGLAYAVGMRMITRGERERQEAIVSNSEFRTPPRDERT